MKINCAPIAAALALLCFPLRAQEDPMQLFLRAREMQQPHGGNDPAGAAALYRKVIEIMPHSSEAHLRLSEALLEIQDISGALESARKAAELAPRSAEAAANLALLESSVARRTRQNADAAKAALNRAARLAPDDPEMWFYLANLCESTQDRAGALTAWSRLGALRPPLSLEGQPVFVIAYERAAFLASALNLYNERREATLALAQEPDATEQHLRMLEDLARDQAEQGYLGHAEESFALLARKFPNEPSVWQNMALVQRQTGRFDEAIENIKRANAIEPDSRNLVQLAYCLMNVGRLEDARAVLHDLISQPDIVGFRGLLDHARGLLASCYILLNRPSELLAIMKAWEGAEESAFLCSQLAHALLQANDMDSAGAALREGMNLFPEQLIFKLASTIPNSVWENGPPYDRESLSALRLVELKSAAYLWAEIGQWDKCLEVVKEVRHLSPSHDFEILLLQSNALEALQLPEESLAVLRLCQSINPGNPVLQNNLGYHLLENGGDVHEAASLIRAALDREPDNPSYLDSWGWALFKQGNFQEAESYLRKAIAAGPLNPEILMHLGEVLLSLGRPQETLVQWEKAMAFAFPDRKQLEGKISSLKTDLAKKALEEDEFEQDPLLDDDYIGWQQ